jgi:hypothetical protein
VEVGWNFDSPRREAVSRGRGWAAGPFEVLLLGGEDAWEGLEWAYKLGSVWVLSAPLDLAGQGFLPETGRNPRQALFPPRSADMLDSF